jgi:type III secretory pathway component EscV
MIALILGFPVPVFACLVLAAMVLAGAVLLIAEFNRRDKQ